MSDYALVRSRSVVLPRSTSTVLVSSDFHTPSIRRTTSVPDLTAYYRYSDRLCRLKPPTCYCQECRYRPQWHTVRSYRTYPSRYSRDYNLWDAAYENWRPYNWTTKSDTTWNTAALEGTRPFKWTSLYDAYAALSYDNYWLSRTDYYPYSSTYWPSRRYFYSGYCPTFTYCSYNYPWGYRHNKCDYYNPYSSWYRSASLDWSARHSWYPYSSYWNRYKSYDYDYPSYYSRYSDPYVRSSLRSTWTPYSSYVLDTAEASLKRGLAMYREGQMNYPTLYNYFLTPNYWDKRHKDWSALYVNDAPYFRQACVSDHARRYVAQWVK